MLTADAFGVVAADFAADARGRDVSLPVRVHRQGGGHGKGRDRAEATFSTCFGAPFLPLAPSRYATMLGERIAQHKARVWLVNTGWTGGPYGVGRRMKIAYTRAMIRAALSGRAGQRRVRQGSDLQPRRADELPGRAGRRAQAAPAPGPTPRPTMRRRKSSRRCSPTTSRRSTRASAPEVRAAGPQGLNWRIGELVSW